MLEKQDQCQAMLRPRRTGVIRPSWRSASARPETVLQQVPQVVHLGRHVPASQDPGVDRVMERLDLATDGRLVVGQVPDRPDVDALAGGLLGGRKRDDTLMLGGAGEAVELRAVFKAHRHAALSREREQLVKAAAGTAASDDNALERAARDEGFLHGVNADETVHWSPIV